MANFVDTLRTLGLFQGGQQQAPQDNTYGLDPAILQQVQGQNQMDQSLRLLAMSQQMTPDQRNQMLGNWTPGADQQRALYNAAQLQIMRNNQIKAAQEAQQTAAARQQLAEALKNEPPGPKRNAAMFFLQAGDYNKAAEILYTPPEYQIIDGYYVTKNDPSAPAIPVEGLAAKSTKDPDATLKWLNAFDQNDAVKMYNNSYAIAESLKSGVYDDTKVADLDFIYGVAKAIDPIGVVRGDDASNIIATQGLDAQTVGQIRATLGGRGALDVQTKKRLYALVKRRGEGLRGIAESRRQRFIQSSGGAVDETDLPPLPAFPDYLLPAPVPAGGRSNPEPRLIGVGE